MIYYLSVFLNDLVVSSYNFITMIVLMRFISTRKIKYVAYGAHLE